VRDEQLRPEVTGLPQRQHDAQHDRPAAQILDQPRQHGLRVQKTHAGVPAGNVGDKRAKVPAAVIGSGCGRCGRDSGGDRG
jgi:hypothetical protein